MSNRSKLCSILYKYSNIVLFFFFRVHCKNYEVYRRQAMLCHVNEQTDYILYIYYLCQTFHPLLINFLIFISSSDINRDLNYSQDWCSIVYAIIPNSASIYLKILLRFKGTVQT